MARNSTGALSKQVTFIIKMPFKTFGLDNTCRKEDVLRTWRRLALQCHSDKTGVTNDTVMQDLNTAKEQCLEQITSRDHILSEQEFAQHICQVLDMRLESEGITGINLSHRGGARIVACRLREFYWLRTVDAMEWILRCTI